MSEAARALASLEPADHRTALAAAAGAVVVTATGDLFVLAVLLALAAGDVLAGGVGALVALACLVRLGSSSLPALAGAQAVLGPAGLSVSAAAASSAWLSAAALLAAAPAGIAGLAFGAAAGAVPAPGTPAGLGVRVAAGAAGAGLAWLAGARLARRPRPLAPALGAAAVVLAALAR